MRNPFRRKADFVPVVTHADPSRATAPDYTNYPYTFPTDRAFFLNCWEGNQLPGTGYFTGQLLFPIQVHAGNQYVQQAGGYDALHGMPAQQQQAWITRLNAARRAIGG